MYGKPILGRHESLTSTLEAAHPLVEFSVLAAPAARNQIPITISLLAMSTAGVTVTLNGFAFAPVAVAASWPRVVAGGAIPGESHGWRPLVIGDG